MTTVNVEANYHFIHEVLHNPKWRAAVIDGTEYPVRVAQNGCRYIDYDDIRFMVQNKHKTINGKPTKDALRAQQGAKITWGISPGKWLKIED